MPMWKLVRVTQRRGGPSLPDATQHGPTRTLPKTRRCKPPNTTAASPGTMPTLADACQRAVLCDPDPALALTMPDAWVNINAATCCVNRPPLRSPRRVIFARQCAPRRVRLIAELRRPPHLPTVRIVNVMVGGHPDTERAYSSGECRIRRR